MDLDKKILVHGTGVDFPKNGDTVALHYTSYLYDASKANNHFMGNKFDSSHNPGRTPLVVPVGVGRLIPGWDKGVRWMTLGEKAILTIPADDAYGSEGYADRVPPNTPLVYEVELLRINNKSV